MILINDRVGSRLRPLRPLPKAPLERKKKNNNNNNSKWGLTGKRKNKGIDVMCILFVVVRN